MILGVSNMKVEIEEIKENYLWKNLCYILSNNKVRRTSPNIYQVYNHRFTSQCHNLHSHYLYSSDLNSVVILEEATILLYYYKSIIVANHFFYIEDTNNL